MLTRILILVGGLFALFALGMAFYLPKAAPRADAPWLVMKQGSVR